MVLSCPPIGRIELFYALRLGALKICSIHFIFIHLFCFYPDEASSLVPVTAEDVARQKQSGHALRRWMILLDDVPVGEMGFCMDDEQLVTKLPQTAWVGIVVGEASARGRGVGETAMKYLNLLTQAGILHSAAAGREKLFINSRLMALLKSDLHEYPPLETV